MDFRRPTEGNSELHPARRAQPITHASIEKLGEDLQLSVKRFLPKFSAPYKKVICLLIAWEYAYQQDEGGVRQDFDEFRGLMQEHFRFEVDEYLIDRTKTQRTIEREVMDKCLQVRPQQDELLIIYYAGHSYYQERSRHTIFT
jgi:Caspase domain